MFLSAATSQSAPARLAPQPISLKKIAHLVFEVGGRLAGLVGLLALPLGLTPAREAMLSSAPATRYAAASQKRRPGGSSLVITPLRLAVRYSLRRSPLSNNA
jgi:hypothetical protein